MTGPEHYAEAERLAVVYKDAITKAEAMPDDTPREANARSDAILGAHMLLSKAHVHATLALAAATAEPSVQRYYGDEAGTDRAWAAAVS